MSTLPRRLPSFCRPSLCLVAALVISIPLLVRAQDESEGSRKDKSPADLAQQEGDWTHDAPGKHHHIDLSELPPAFATESVRNGPHEAKRPEGAMPQVPKGFKIEVYATRPHPRLGASIVGARRPLAAFNVVLDSSDLELGKTVARAVRARLAGVRVLPMWLESRSLVQISMNLTDPEQSGLWAAFAAVSEEAGKLGASVVSSELIGLASLGVLLEAARGALKLDALDPARVVEWHRWKMNSA